MENQATEPIIEFLDVKKEYFLYKNEKARFKAIFTKNRGVKKHPALKGVSFKIYPGESVGIIGKNGAGKSTILKMITGVSFPNSGTITVRGKVAALLELTAGFSLLLKVCVANAQCLVNNEDIRLDIYIDSKAKTHFHSA